MERLRQFLHRTVDAGRLADREGLAGLGARVRYAPDVFSDFDEFELAFALPGGREMALCIAVERRSVERIIVGQVPAGDDDADVRPLHGEDLSAALAVAGPAAAAALSWLTDSGPKPAGGG
jgi:hypothetical protein